MGVKTRKKDTRSNWNSGKDVVFDQHMRISYIWALENVLNREGVVASFFPPVVTDSKLKFESDVFFDEFVAYNARTMWRLETGD